MSLALALTLEHVALREPVGTPSVVEHPTVHLEDIFGPLFGLAPARDVDPHAMVERIWATLQGSVRHWRWILTRIRKVMWARKTVDRALRRHIRLRRLHFIIAIRKWHTHEVRANAASASRGRRQKVVVAAKQKRRILGQLHLEHVHRLMEELQRELAGRRELLADIRQHGRRIAAHWLCGGWEAAEMRLLLTSYATLQDRLKRAAEWTPSHDLFWAAALPTNWAKVARLYSTPGLEEDSDLTALQDCLDMADEIRVALEETKRTVLEGKGSSVNLRHASTSQEQAVHSPQAGLAQRAASFAQRSAPKPAKVPKDDAPEAEPGSPARRATLSRGLSVRRGPPPAVDGAAAVRPSGAPRDVQNGAAPTPAPTPEARVSPATVPTITGALPARKKTRPVGTARAAKHRPPASPGPSRRLEVTGQTHSPTQRPTRCSPTPSSPTSPTSPASLTPSSPASMTSEDGSNMGRPTFGDGRPLGSPTATVGTGCAVSMRDLVLAINSNNFIDGSNESKRVRSPLTNRLSSNDLTLRTSATEFLKESGPYSRFHIPQSSSFKLQSFSPKASSTWTE
eukprot:EG_transcript_3903